TFSLLWRFELELSALSGLSLAVGVALIRALNVLGMGNARLKWPNDVLNGNDGKLAGILLEAQGDMLGPSVVVIGIGLNLSKPAHLLPQIDQSVSSLEDMVAGMPGVKLPERNILFAVILSELQGVLHEFASNGFAALREEWESHHAWYNQLVRLRLPDGRNETGIARGVTENGALILETAGGMQIVNAGEIGLRAS
ncbi:MAG: biotin--[acetyl-CoA-carboxylase] ligase, partial [Candidatus Nitrotoga sp.]